MKTEKVNSSSVSSLSAREELLSKSLEQSTEMLLVVDRFFGQDSVKFMVAEKFVDLLKKEYEFLVARREYDALCLEHRMMFGVDQLNEAAGLERMRRANEEFVQKLKAMGLN
jgi:hypothetical protein